MRTSLSVSRLFVAALAVAGGLAAAVWFGGDARAQNESELGVSAASDDPDTPSVLRHEPVPAQVGLMGAPGDAPAVLIEDGDADGAVSGEGPDTGDTSDDIVYRTRSAGTSDDPSTVQNVEDTVRPDRETGREPWLNYHAVFDPAVIPFKRNSAKDKVDSSGGIVIGDKALRKLAVRRNRVERGREVFYGSILVELEPGVPIPIPSVAPESNVLSADTTPRTELTFYRDGADNLYVESSGQGRARLNYVLDAPSYWFAFKPDAAHRFEDIPDSLRPSLSAGLQADAEEVAREIGITARDRYSNALQKLVWWFRSFEPGDLPESDAGLYVELALARRGVCRHRSYAFVITAHGLGIPARYVSNEAHVFVEVYVPNTGWVRIDLGGGAQGMNVRGADGHALHQPRDDDPWGFPSGFRSGYSHRAATGGSGSGDPVRGLPADSDRGDVGAGSPTPSRFGRPGVSPFEVDSRKKRSKTTLGSSVATIFRGEAFGVQGRVTTAAGRPIRDGLVRLQLMDTELTEIIMLLGTTRTDKDGRFETRVTIPLEAEPGQWEVIAEFLGDGIYGPSHSE